MTFVKVSFIPDNDLSHQAEVSPAQHEVKYRVWCVSCDLHPVDVVALSCPIATLSVTLYMKRDGAISERGGRSP